MGTRCHTCSLPGIVADGLQLILDEKRVSILEERANRFTIECRAPRVELATSIVTGYWLQMSLEHRMATAYPAAWAQQAHLLHRTSSVLTILIAVSELVDRSLPPKKRLRCLDTPPLCAHVSFI